MMKRRQRLLACFISLFASATGEQADEKSLTTNQTSEISPDLVPVIPEHLLSFTNSLSNQRSLLPAHCDEMIYNGFGKAERPEDGWYCFSCDLVVQQFAASPGAKSFKSYRRENASAGLGQIVHLNYYRDCFVPGEKLHFTAELILISRGTPYACNTNTWGQELTCPVFSVLIVGQDNSATWVNAWNEIDYSDGNWVPTSWNPYSAEFTIPPEVTTAKNIIYFIRGPPSTTVIMMSDLSLVPVPSEIEPPSGVPSVVPTPADSSVPSETPTTLSSLSPTLLPTVTNSTTPTLLPSLSISPSEVPTFLEPSSSPSYFILKRNVTTSSCDMGISDGDFELGKSNPAPWSVHLGGILSLYSKGANNSTYALKMGGRTAEEMAPKHPLNVECFVKDKQFEVTASIKLAKTKSITNGTSTSLIEEPYTCNAFAGRNSTCPILTVEVIYDVGDEHIYQPNNYVQKWDGGDFNEFHATFEVTEEMTEAREAYFYFERPPPGVDIIIDDVDVREFQPLPEGNILLEGDDSMSLDCDDMIVNGDAELGDTSGWTARLGGQLSVRPEGAGLTSYSFEHSGRTSFIMGPRHALKLNCFIPGMIYEFDAKIKLLDEDDMPFECDKTHTWIDESSCPLLTFQLETGAEKNWKYYINDIEDPWNKFGWNSYHAYFTVTEEFSTATSGYFYIERPRAGIKIVLDEVTISRDCVSLIPNNDAEKDSTQGWSPKNGGGYIDIYDGGAQNSSKAFAHFGRTSAHGGPGHLLDTGCLTNGTRYTFTADLQLLDEASGSFFACKKGWHGDNEYACPVLAITCFDEERNPKTHFYSNIDATTWEEERFNRYKAVFEVSEGLSKSNEVYFFIKGPKAGVAIIFDNINVDLYESKVPDCQKVIDYSFEDQNADGWNVFNGGSIQIYPDGANGSSFSLKFWNEGHHDSGPMYDMYPSCLVEGRQYVINAYTKMVTDNNEPLGCDKHIHNYGSNSCTFLGLSYSVNGVEKTLFPENFDPSVYVADEWNFFHTVFTVTHEIAKADFAFFMFRGVGRDKNLLIDDMKMEAYVPPEYNCTQLVTNPGAEGGSLYPWQSYGGGYLSIKEYDAGEGDGHYFIHTHRTYHHHGPSQHIPVDCLIEGAKWDFYAHVKLFDENGIGYACDKTAVWGSELSCPILSFEVRDLNGLTRSHAWNLYGGDWIADEFNQFRASVTVTERMAHATSVEFWFQGPPAGKSIGLDNVSMIPHSTTS